MKNNKEKQIEEQNEQPKTEKVVFDLNDSPKDSREVILVHDEFSGLRIELGSQLKSITELADLYLNIKNNLRPITKEKKKIDYVK